MLLKSSFTVMFLSLMLNFMPLHIINKYLKYCVCTFLMSFIMRHVNENKNGQLNRKVTSINEVSVNCFITSQNNKFRCTVYAPCYYVFIITHTAIRIKYKTHIFLNYPSYKFHLKLKMMSCRK
jgi:hypothetical protein